MPEKQPFQPEFYKVKRKPSQKQIAANRKNGRKGGLAKGTGAILMTPEQRRENGRKGGLKSGGNIQAYNEKRKQDLKGKDLHV